MSSPWCGPFYNFQLWHTSSSVDINPMISIQFVALGYLIFIKLWNSIINRDFIQMLAKSMNVRVKLIQKHVDGVQASWWIALAVSIICYFLVLMNSLTWYRRQVLMLRAGNRSFLPNSIKKGSIDSGSLMVSCMKFAGYQVGYSAWGFIITFMIVWLITAFLSVFLVVPAFFGGPSFLITLILNYWPTALVALITIIVQGQIAKRVFLISEENVGVDNRRAFHITSYILFYFNVFIGIVSCLLRIGYGALIGVMFLQRLPKSTLPRSYERRDPGYMAYLGFLMVEHQHSNPVLQCFVRILLQHIDKDMSLDEYTHIRSHKVDSMLGMDIELEDGGNNRDSCEVAMTNFEKNKKIRARNRWHLCVILLQNPSLRKYRGRHLKRNISSGKHLMRAMETKLMASSTPFGIDDNIDISVDSVREATVGYKAVKSIDANESDSHDSSDANSVCNNEEKAIMTDATILDNKEDNGTNDRIKYAKLPPNSTKC